MAWVEIWTATYTDTTNNPDAEPVIIVSPSETDCVIQMSSRLHWDRGTNRVHTWEALKEQIDRHGGGKIRVTKPFKTMFDPEEVTMCGGF